MSKQRICTVLLAILLLSTFWITPAQAQVQDGAWSEPYRLSSPGAVSSEGYLVTDQYGYVHCFWIEIPFESSSSIIKYARFDGTTWTKANDIYVTDLEIRNISPFVDKNGILYITWSESVEDHTVAAYYTYAPANAGLSAQSWAQPEQIKIPARILYFRVDSKSVFHIVYINQTEEAGVYYIRSEDRGMTWSEPTWLDPDILPKHIPDSLSFALDENDGLHAVWFYGTRERDEVSDWVRYVHSLDGGHTWSAPFTIDRYIEGTDYSLESAGPIMTVQGQTVHVIWAAGTLHNRNHRYSTDAGRTWSTTAQIFGDLQGQAFDGLAVDGRGRVHFFGQVRYPMGIYHAYWDGTRWTIPSLVYLIAEQGSEEGIGNRIHAHYTLPVVRAGNQLVLTFTDGPADPNRRLFVMSRTLDDIPSLESLPTPEPMAPVVPLTGPTSAPPTAMPTWTATPPLLESAKALPVGRLPAPDLAIRVALIPTILVLGATMFFQILNRRKP